MSLWMSFNPCVNWLYSYNTIVEMNICAASPHTICAPAHSSPKINHAMPKVPLQRAWSLHYRRLIIYWMMATGTPGEFHPELKSLLQPCSFLNHPIILLCLHSQIKLSNLWTQPTSYSHQPDFEKLSNVGYVLNIGWRISTAHPGNWDVAAL